MEQSRQGVKGTSNSASPSETPDTSLRPFRGLASRIPPTPETITRPSRETKKLKYSLGDERKSLKNISRSRLVNPKAPERPDLEE